MNKLVIGIIVILVLVTAIAYTLTPYVLPKIVWTHWDTDALPELCRANLEQTKRILHDWDVRFFTTAEFLKWLPVHPPGFDALGIQSKTDFMRLWLLKHHGGVWMDISIVLNTSINPIYEECVRQQAALSGFYIEGLTTNPQYPVFESWFIMAPQGSRLIALWYEEFVTAMRKGFAPYKDSVIAEGVDPQKILDFDLYLTIHLCYQTVIQKRMWIPQRIIQAKAEDTMYRIHSKCKWDTQCMKSMFNAIDMTDVPYIKLRGPDRALFPIHRLKVMPHAPT
jgi:hypothetical protein